MIYKLRTQVSNNSVKDFLNGIEDPKKQSEANILHELFQKVSGTEAKIWGDSIIGFGSYHYVYASGQEGDWMRTGFAPRKTGFSVYIMPGYQFGDMQNLLSKLGKHKVGKSCLTFKKLQDINIEVLEQIIKVGLEKIDDMYPG